MNTSDFDSLSKKVRTANSEIAKGAPDRRWVTSSKREFIIPLARGNVRFPPMTEEDYELLMGTLTLWKKRIIDTGHSDDIPENPSDSDKI